MSIYVMTGASIIPFAEKTPRIGVNSFLANGAHLIGDLQTGSDCSFWFNTTVRADCNHISIGDRVNIQDGSVVHVTGGTGPTIIGSDVTIGHNCTIHACTIEDLCLIGMGSVLLDGAIISRESWVAAGSLVTPGKRFPPRSMIMGSPAKAVRELRDDEVQLIRDSVKNYLDYKAGYFGLARAQDGLQT
jgi:carbonic anhydrase/acetyltransferase-like protein (isoleucine patch superfamily)